MSDSYSVILEKADKSLAASLARDRDFPRGPASRALVLNHMRNSGTFSPEQIEQVGNLLTNAGIQ